MSPDPSAPLAFPPALQARLNAAGVTDDASLQAALENDPSLRADFDAFFQQNPELFAAMQMNALLDAFAAVRDGAQMMAFWRGVPTELEEPFMQAVEQVIAQAQAAGDADTVNHLTPRLEGFRQVRQINEMPPVMRAVTAFIQAADDGAAAALFAEQRHLLQPYEAQQVLDTLTAQASPDTPAKVRDRLTARQNLLRRLRGAAPTVDPLAGAPPLADALGSDDAPLAPRPSHVHGDLYQAQEQHFQSAIADRGGVATVVNNIFVQSIERRWSRPTPPELGRDAVARAHEMAQIKAALAARGGVAITGEAVAPTPAIRRTPSLAVQGMAGVGKTVLAYLLAQELDAVYADGVIWEPLGPDFTAPAQAQAVLRRWAGYATNFFALDDNAQRAFTFEPAAVRTLLAEHPHLLVVLDNVWSLDAIKPLQAALPPGVHLVITTRSAEIARGLGAGRVEIGRLSDDEAAALVALRLGWQPQRDAPADAWVFALIEGIGGHALGLDVALGVLQREGGGDRGEWQAAALRLLAAIRRGDLGDLTLGDALDHNVQAVLLYSVRTLDAETQRRFRRSGALAPDAVFTTDDMAAVWGCDADSARRTLVAFANAALVERAAEGGGRWRQHALLRGLALALLRAAGEEEAAAHAHARAYAAAMRAAADAQRYHELLPAMPQLRHAMQWAQANDLELALDIAAASANLQQQFGLVGEAGEWSAAILAAAQRRATPATLARAWGHRANILSELATLPGEDRRQRLYDALAAYDEALRHYRPDTAPLDYAATQNNRANRLSELATLPGEDRRQRLYDALAAYDEALRFRRPDTAPLDYAMTQNNRANILSELATLPGEDRRQRLYDALAAYDEALRHYRPDTAPLAYAMTQNNRANRLSELATLPGEDRRQRLYDALAAYDEALRHYRPDTAPLDYAATQNNRATILSELATLPGENRRQRLYDALAAYDEALRHYRPDTAPLDYAMTQNNRATILSALATLPGEDRRGRLYEALAAYDDALRYRRPENAPLDYAQTQNNRATILSALATLPGEDRRGRLYEALAAYDDALRYHRPENAPLDYAQTQNNRANILSALATLPGEDRRGRLYEALAAYDDALRYRRPENAPLDYAQTQGNRAILLADLSEIEEENQRFRQSQSIQAAVEAWKTYHKVGHINVEWAQSLVVNRRKRFGADVFDMLWAELGLGAPPDWLKEGSDGDEPAPALPADLQARLAAGVTDEASLQAALEADPSLRADFEAFFPQNPQLVAAMQMNALLQAFAAVNNTEEMIAFWRSVPTELEEPFVQAVAQLIDQAGAAGEAETVKVLRSRLEGFQEMRAGAARTLARQEPLLAHLEHYQALLQAADAEQPQVEPWRGVTQAGESILALQPGAEHLLNWDALRELVADDYNTLGNALDSAGDKAAALAAFERASELQPDFAMWRRNQTGMLIELGRLDAARAALAAARALEPDAPRLAELEAELAAAEGKEE